ncbi:STIP1 homology and U-box containing protein 1 [Marchantia polymorpha subsp. ruderalis]|uniref:E3 ubiquitin-protein ligase CHIP n=4 Tax=Marchantia polymorpha TaxID=3197 RepID=A0A176VNA1_MARPO|nr:hypothetical protein AXG93_1175s1060 [Marchantia polymorpha subsp. ruderalis]PTQ46530.1 hypothetical protein MARPO_0011s0187 [Marchantia polymorpha]BBN08494.1 hypothetical protein Mp_4g12050 [Marchantia polymorpha subsp. ruderalis]|eukprot:PTQ46530.1 hypothetical protein MARPO_0011s0187 [Marchantia polymorpha]
MSPGVASAEKQAEILKDQGNVYFKKERLSAAIDAYTEAITLCPLIPVYWTNRALCHRKRNEWERVESDCRKALELDKDSVKAHYMLGLALLQSQQYREAVKQLEKALELGRGGKPGTYMVEEIWQELAKARYTEWEQGALVRKRQQKDLKELCERLLKEDCERRLTIADVNTAPVKQSLVEIDGVIQLDDDEFSGDENKSDDPPNEEITKLYHQHLETLTQVFDKAGAPDRPVEVPDHLCCKITMDIFRDPVITPSGVTYERATLLEHLRKVGKFDPVTRTPLSSDLVVPNLAMKEAVQAYLDDHGWAYRTY